MASNLESYTQLKEQSRLKINLRHFQTYKVCKVYLPHILFPLLLSWNGSRRMNSIQRGNIRTRSLGIQDTGGAPLRRGQENSQDEDRGMSPKGSCAGGGEGGLQRSSSEHSRRSGDQRALPTGTVKKTKGNKTLGGYVHLIVLKFIHLESLGAN